MTRQFSKVTKLSFDRPVVLLVEGWADQYLTKAILDSIGTGTQWQVHCMEGRDTDWAAAVEVVLSDPPFMKSGAALGLVLDADRNPSAAFAHGVEVLRSNKLKSPDAPGVRDDGALRTGVYVIPGDDRTGAVEDLIWDAAEPERRGLADAFARQVESVVEPFASPMKSRVLGYYASQKEYVESTTVALLRREVVSPDATALQGYRAFLVALGAPGS